MNGYDEDLTAILRGRGVEDVVVLRHAFAVVERAHRGTRRRSGDPYLTHPLAVARILAEREDDTEVLAVALLHDLTDVRHVYPEERLRAEFGDRVADLLAAFSRVEAAWSVDDVLDADPRALRIKVVDRLHNVRTIRFIEPRKRLMKADRPCRSSHRWRGRSA